MKTLIPLGIAGALFTSSSLAFNPVCGWYAGFIVGGSYAPDVDFTVTAHPFYTTPLRGEIDYRFGFGGGAQLGYRVYEHFRVEAQALYYSNEFSKLTINGEVVPRHGSHAPPGLSMHGRSNLMGGFINAYYEFMSQCDDDNRMVPYIGLGIGYTSLKNSVVFYFDDLRLIPTDVSSTQSGPGAQGIIGFSYFLDDYTTASLDYRYIATNSITDFNNSRYALHTLNLTMNFAFDL